MKKSTICTRNARTFFVRAVSVSIIDQLKLYDSFCLCLANVHLPYLLHLVFSFQLLGHAVSLRQRLHDQFHAVLCRFVNLGAILPYAHPDISAALLETVENRYFTKSLSLTRNPGRWRRFFRCSPWLAPAGRAAELCEAERGGVGIPAAVWFFGTAPPLRQCPVPGHCQLPPKGEPRDFF